MENFIKALKLQNINSLLQIQELSIRPILENKNIVLQSPTGSGKTLAYLLPIFKKTNTSLKQVQTLILCPTHELVVQIADQIRLLSKNSNYNLSCTTLIGGANINKQIEILKKNKPHIVVASTGRALELIIKKKLPAHTIKTLVIDEADTLLSKNQREDILKIKQSLQKDVQIICCSATISENLKNDISLLVKDPVFIDTEETVNQNIDHKFIVTEKRKKFDELRTFLNKEAPYKSLIFINNNHEVDNIVSKLQHHNFKAIGLSSSQDKQKRSSAMMQFRIGKSNILVSSDVSARGLDVPDISHIFNLDLPKSSADYIHRAGRTARGINSGTSIGIITQGEEKILKEYEKKLKIFFSPIC
ncbi:hypothetical protein AN639_01015 [Candidatus Epulonipiscium fishelsonii]|uniref:Uncharacterized protein n=1 Tax=Candidatus Epulonipiscium fishelsonii TaxID=77094 RepID=A0ACC8XCL4_9FIRM|nr:hypothetical protein AN396_06190 [Epulopiscium sp. SCG-B11WGA-EpuloA1]ONI41374.1 hypothetical protein AN639_01015 [Epulopiscium sp. SCG-B05WGA-EpuloA1]